MSQRLDFRLLYSFVAPRPCLNRLLLVRQNRNLVSELAARPLLDSWTGPQNNRRTRHQTAGQASLRRDRLGSYRIVTTVSIEPSVLAFWAASP